MAKSARDGLIWDDSYIVLEPKWQREPSTEAILAVCLKHLGRETPDDFEVSFLSAGAFNRSYIVESKHAGTKLVMRVSLPVDPRRKTVGEVTTLGWIRSHTLVPVPRVVTFDDSSDNEIGFEWILMQFVPGTSLLYSWRKMSMLAKEALVKQVAEYQVQILRASERLGFGGIGTLTTDRPPKQGPADEGNDDPKPEPETEPVPGRIVSRLFFWGDRFDYDTPRGPFRSSHDWLSSLINIVIKDQEIAIEKEEDEDDKADYIHAKQVAVRLAGLLPKIFPSIHHPPERSSLWHDDLSLQNILVDERGAITAIIDWESLATMPRWVTTQFPDFLSGNSREVQPLRDAYADDDDEDDGADAQTSLNRDGLDNEGKNELYWINLLEYEQTQLRKVYAQHMCDLWPDWGLEMVEGALKMDFLEAVLRCTSGWSVRSLDRWIDEVEGGGFLGLHRL
ncbi:hypothetical protein PT974_02490 [Cladobotryum mycophilum]|uniref:Aminoglycoside phosphotransferase domain-containing protein n=1 Tax=Cladobotryum mycophilum TaxID=491253 RepID=A0ABR0SY93_9HYPO